MGFCGLKTKPILSWSEYFEDFEAVSVGHAGYVIADGSFKPIFINKSPEVAGHKLRVDA